jgi:heme/copper-type cytochrome/quinol oxidase subunit 1
MPRRVAAYLDADAGWNFASAIGAYTFALGLVFAVNAVLGFRRKQAAGANPWARAPPHWNGRCRRVSTNSRRCR